MRKKFSDPCNELTSAVETKGVTADNRIPTIPSVSAAVTHAQAFALIEPEIEAFPDDALVSITTHIPRAVSLALAAANRMSTLLPALAELPDYPVHRVQKLRFYAGALMYAHLQVAGTAGGGRTVPALVEEAIILRKDLLVVAHALAQLGLIPTSSVAAIPRGRGYRCIATDLAALALLYERAWPRLSGKVPVTRAMIERAEVLAAELLTLVGERGLEATNRGLVDEARKTRERAYSLFMEVYDTCRQGVTFLRWRHGDTHRFVPSLHPRRRRQVTRKLGAIQMPAPERGVSANEPPSTEEPTGQGRPTG